MASDRAYFEAYYLVNTVMYEEASWDNCDARSQYPATDRSMMCIICLCRCQLFHHCAMMYLDYDQFETCVTSTNISYGL